MDFSSSLILEPWMALDVQICLCRFRDFPARRFGDLVRGPGTRLYFLPSSVSRRAQDGHNQTDLAAKYLEMSDLRKKCIGFTIQPWQEEKLPVACCQRTSNFRSKDDKPPMYERAEFQAGGREYQKK
jgi:hypothetical protein